MNAIVRLYKHLISRCWIIGIADFRNDIIDNAGELNIKWIKNPHTSGWFADPFILYETDELIAVLVEEFPYVIRKGRISRLLINKANWNIVDVKVVLELDTHLSFPCFFRYNGKIYIYPENSAAGHLILYEYDDDLATVRPVEELSRNSLTDAVIYDVTGVHYIFSTQHPTENDNHLEIYKMENNHFSSLPYLTVEFNENIARNAGKPFYVSGRLVRPAQICNTGYGEGVVLQEIKFKGHDNIEFIELRRLYSPCRFYRLAFHTFNVFENKYIIVDAQGYRHKILGPLLGNIAGVVKKMTGYDNRK